jgi:hypothetical protein
LASLTGFYQRHNGAKTTVFLCSTKSSTMIPFFYSRDYTCISTYLSVART